MDSTLALDEIDRHVADVFDANVPATHCIRLVCEYCGRFSILPVPGPGVDREKPWVCPICAPDFEEDFLTLLGRRCEVQPGAGAGCEGAVGVETR